MSNINDGDQTIADVVEEMRQAKRYADKERKRGVPFGQSKMPRGKAPLNIVHETLKKNGLL